MDQDAFRETYHDVNQRACVFERAVLTNQCRCSKAERFCIAEREGVACKSGEGFQRCETLISLLKGQARFALRSTGADPSEAMPYGKAMRVQVGGMRGLQALVDKAALELGDLPEVYALTARAEKEYESLEKIPFSEIMPHIASYRGKIRSRRRRK